MQVYDKSYKSYFIISLAKKEKDESSLAIVFLLLKISAAWNSKNVYKFLNIPQKSLIQQNILGIPSIRKHQMRISRCA